MTTSLLQGKTFYCREWAFSKLQHCLESRPTSKTCGALIMGGPGCGKTALCCQTVWPTVSVGKQLALSARILAYHFCQAHDIETLSITNFVHSMVDQLCTSSKLNGYEEILKERGLLDALDPLQCEKDPDTAFVKTVLEPLEAIEPPDRNLIILVDSIDESYLQSISERTSGSRTIAELLANHHHLFPKWLLLVCSARKGSKAITRMFTGFRKISLDDLHKTHVVRDVQQYILCRLDREEKLRQHLSRDTAEMLNQLHIKSNGCFLYLEKVLDGVSDNFIMLREIKEIPGTLNGLYLWLCQRLFVRKQFAKIQPILNVILAARRPLTEMELYTCCWTRNVKLTIEEFSKRIDILSKVLLEGPNKTKILFHHSFAEWILDVKHCTQKYLCTASEGHSMLAMSFTLHAENLAAVEVQDFALHLSKSTAVNHLEPFHLALWLIESGANVHDSLSVGMPKEQHVIKLLLDAGAALPDPDGPNSVHCSREDLLAEVEESCMLAPEPQQIDSNGMTDLASAAHSGNLTVLLDLLNTNVDLESQDKQGQTPINLAARQGHIEIVAALLNAGVNVNHTDNDGWSPLRSAAWGGHTEVVSLLLSAGADVDHVDTDMRTALRAAAWGGHEDIVIKLLEHGANVNKTDNEGRTALIAGAYMGHCEIVEHLLDNSANINHQDCDGRTALSVAALCLPASKGHSTVISLLLDRGADVNHRDNDGMTPLLVAAYEGQYQVCELLLEADADVDQCDNNGRSPLQAAASAGHVDIISLLLFWGAGIDHIDSDGRTVLSIAAQQGNTESVALLLDRGLDEMHRDNMGLTPLHLAAYEGHKPVCEQLLEQGAKVCEVDNEGRIPLILAAQEGNLEIVQLLIEAESNPEHKSHDGRTALRVAVLEGHIDVINYLVHTGCDINCVDADGRSILYVLALENKLEIADLLLENCAECDVESCDHEGRTPLHVAAWQGHSDMVELLLSHCADVNAVDNDNRTALQSAAWQGDAKIVKLLLERGAEVDHACNQGATALCISAQEGHEDVVRVLLKYQADPSHTDQFGRTASRVAIKGGHTGVVKVLEEFSSLPMSNGTNGTKNTNTSESKQSSLSHVSMVSQAMMSLATETTSSHTGPHTSSSESPTTTMDRRKSYVSNESSSNLTSSNTGTMSTNQSSNSMPHDPHNMTFTQQLQQCTSRSRNRPLSKMLSPVSEPHESPVHSPIQSPLSDITPKTSENKLINGMNMPIYHELEPPPQRSLVAPIRIISNPNEVYNLNEIDDDQIWQAKPRPTYSVEPASITRKGKGPVMGRAALTIHSPDTRQPQRHNGVTPKYSYAKNVKTDVYQAKNNPALKQQAPEKNIDLNKAGPSMQLVVNTGFRKPPKRPTKLAIDKETPL